MKKISIIKYLLFFSFFNLLAFNSTTVSATNNNNLINITDKYISVKDGHFFINNENALKDELSQKKLLIKEINSTIDIKNIVEALKNRITSLNNSADFNLITINRTKKITNNTLELRVAGQVTTHHWWGTKHTFHWDDSARDYAYQLRMLAHANAGVGLLGGAIFGGIGAVPNGLSAIYGYMIADSVDYNANKNGDGVILDVNWWLTFSCYPR